MMRKDPIGSPSDSESESDEPIEVEAITSTELKDLRVSTKEVSAGTETRISAFLIEHGTPPCSKIVLGDTASNRHKEQPLREYVPSLYICVLEGTLLTNGDLKGSWRMRRGDTLSNEFRMVLMGRGMYDGGFNITAVSSDDPSKNFLHEVHDKWFELEWCSTTGRSSNIWGRGRNLRFGECHLLGSHDAVTRTIVLYKVEEAERKRAQMYARNPGTVLASRPPLSAIPGTRQKWQQQAIDSGNSKMTTNLSVCASATGESIAQNKRPHSCSRAGGDFVSAASALAETASSGTDGRSVNAKRRIYPPGHPAYNRTRAQPSHTVCIVGAISSCVSSDSGSDSDSSRNSNTEVDRPQSVVGSKHKEAGPQLSKMRKGQSSNGRGTLPGFSGFGDDDDEEPDHDTEEQQGDISDLTAHTIKMQKEKAEILENFSALTSSLGKAKADFQQHISKTAEEEQAMLKAFKTTRRKREGLEAGLETVSARFERAKKDEVQLLKAWDEKWAVEVQPFIAQHEKEVKRKAEELERKTKQVEKEKLELQQELAQLQNVKQIAILDVSGDIDTTLR